MYTTEENSVCHKVRILSSLFLYCPTLCKVVFILIHAKVVDQNDDIATRMDTHLFLALPRVQMAQHSR